VKTAKDPQSDRPYLDIAGELVADAIALLHQVRARRPEVKDFPGTLHVSLDGAGGVIVVGLVQDSGQVVLIERILVDPLQPATFGASELPIAVDERTH
jgi:hypothetical protein